MHRSPPEHLVRMILHRSQACDVRGLVIALPGREGGRGGLGPPRCGCALGMTVREGTNLPGAVDMLAWFRGFCEDSRVGPLEGQNHPAKE